MNCSNDVSQSPAWRALPLCGRYFAVLFSDQYASVGLLDHQLTHWGLGVLPDGQCDVLGVWMAPTSFQTLSQTVLEDLKLRGVEIVRFFVSNDSAELRADACIAYPGTTVLPSIGHLLCESLAQVAQRDRRALADTIGAIAALRSAEAADDALSELANGPLGALYPAVVGRLRAVVEQLGPLYALAPRRRRLLLFGDGVVQQMHQRLLHAVSRHGSFADREVAMSFLAEALRRAERFLQAHGMDCVAGARAPVARRGTRLGTQALAF